MRRIKTAKMIPGVSAIGATHMKCKSTDAADRKCYKKYSFHKKSHFLFNKIINLNVNKLAIVFFTDEHNHAFL
jgi:hypothetical protein